ncbi:MULTISPECIES: immune inhibitor A domain-containing protein [unclassified Streptomyces]|uniref:immune inhibitor A domain-containing protein n=1 Tax=unclassified Streptomyces TaxID=2593676 RepID=UPI00344ED5E3
MTIRYRTLSTATAAVALAAVAAAFSPLAVAQAGESAPADRKSPVNLTQSDHDLDGPMSKTQAALREEALTQVMSGETAVENRDGSRVVELKSTRGKSKYVELGRERTDKVLAILVEFGDQTDSRYGGAPGPLHNQIPQPDRTKDNSTAWKPDYDQKHYQELYFGTGKNTESVKKYYERQSSGRYSIEGQVEDWVKLPYNAARYGNNACGGMICDDVWNLVGDGLSAWAAQQKEAGSTDAEIKAEAEQFDQWDRYDFDKDGDFNEPDGYIDHLQIVHAGSGEETGGGAQGTDAIWSHRWYAFGSDIGTTGPSANRLGGAQIGDTGIWAGDYTIQPEDGGLGVLAHEYGHDLGLPDHYDTAGGVNSTAFWTLMSAGSWLGRSETEVGELPGDLTAWDKMQLGWLDYDTAKAGTHSTHELGVAEYNTDRKQALVVELPKKKVATDIVAPSQGTTQWWSGSGDNLSQTLTRSVDLTGISSAALTLDGWWDTELGHDYLYTEVSTDGGADWKAVDGTADGAALGRDGNGDPAIEGSSGDFKKLVFPLDAYAGKKVDLRLRYSTDAAVSQKGFAADRIAVTADGSSLFSDDAESADAAWTAQGFSRIGGSITSEHEQYYIAENRQYVSYDMSLRTAHYYSTPTWVNRYPYQNGLLIWKLDTSQQDNNTSQHPGVGYLLPVDAHPEALTWRDSTLMDNFFQSFDSPFTLGPTDAITLEDTEIRSREGVSVFDDRINTYYDETNPTGGVKITDTNTRIEILDEAEDGSSVSLQVGPSAA